VGVFGDLTVLLKALECENRGPEQR